MINDLHQMKNRLEAKRDKLRKNISGLSEAHPVPTDPIEGSEGPNDFEDIAIDFLEIHKEHVTFSRGARSGTMQMLTAKEKILK